MAGVQQTWGEYGASLREDVIDIIFQITPTDTPFYNDIGDTAANDTDHGWTTRGLTVRADNAQTEGAVFAGAYTAGNFPDRVRNRTQIFRKLPQVARSMASSNMIGVKNLMADQIQINMQEFKTDIEHALIRGSLASGSTDNSVRRLNGLVNSMLEGPTNGNRFDYSTAGTFTESAFNDLLEQVWLDGGNPANCLVNSAIKRSIGSFGSTLTKNIQADDKRVVNVVTVIETDFGVTNVKLSRDVSGAADLYDCIVYDHSFYKKAWLDAPFVERIPKVGDSEEAVILAEGTLEYGNQLAAGMIQHIENHGR